jgi:type I restriction enzyme S subunit
VLVLNQKCIRGGAINPVFGRRHDSESKAIDGRELHVWDILVNSTGVGTLGRVAQVRELAEPTIIDSHVTVVHAATSVATAHFLGTCLLRAEPEIEALGEGITGQIELSRDRLGGLRVVVPGMPVQHCFDEFVLPVRLRQAGNQRENKHLAALRDELLPRLLSGELSVAQAVRAVEATL